MKGRKAVVTGGLGFIGSNLVIRLVEMGAEVTVIDPSVTGCGGNPANIAPVADRVNLLPYSVGDTDKLETTLARAEIIFNLAGEISHIHSMMYPERDLEINTLAQLRFVQACVNDAPGIRIVYAGTRQVYGIPEYLPVDEKHPVNPVDFNGVHKYAAAQYHEMLSRSGHIDAVVLRLTNIYGPRIALDVPCQGFLGNFFRKALTGQKLQVFGDGSHLRDPVYVDDAVDAMLRAATVSRFESRRYNIGGVERLSLLQIATALSELAGIEPPELTPFPPGRQSIDIGSYETDSSLALSGLGWRASTPFRAGAERTIEYYRSRLHEYLNTDEPNPTCKLLHQGRTPRLRLVSL
jgi:nucleoside-diphosphate-sugar epimerase